MSQNSRIVEQLFAGETVSIENTELEPLSISLASDTGCHLEFELMSGQVLSFSTGNENAKILLLHGNPAGLLVIRPEAAS